MSDLVIKDKNVLSILQESVDMGTEDAGTSGNLPFLKITTSMSKDNFLSDGKKATVGMIFHTELKEEFELLKTNIVYVGQFQLPDFVTKEPKMTYVMGGVLVADNSPFILFSKGFSLQPTWNFLGEIANIKNRYKLPMFCLNVNIKVGQRPHEKYKEVDVWNFEIARKDGVLVIEQDKDRLLFLKESVLQFKDKVQSLVEQENQDPILEQESRDIQEVLE